MRYVFKESSTDQTFTVVLPQFCFLVHVLVLIFHIQCNLELWIKGVDVFDVDVLVARVL